MKVGPGDLAQRALRESEHALREPQRKENEVQLQEEEEVQLE
eukprot:CAMPEP_0185583536 /NCGR_PEP_ID=MMETSP0434-20130131/25056_1 /TAXON_ID=626734 ORGANISM="Favella taraikaensis, Strain Fe Narragansett Bay" /NCGR_SAMPLE_ID=MMETSP0434 /ASSEMBLY_ACC=CAM_ASM_000379 /LENGTH=41 /DNA_ID= /DNA_START= /DNA_END= /DNA_ORIENTATION=